MRGAASAGTMVDFMTSGGPNEAATIALCDMPRNDRPLRLADTAPDTRATPRNMKTKRGPKVCEHITIGCEDDANMFESCSDTH